MAIFNYTSIKDVVNREAFLPGQYGTRFYPNRVTVPAIAEETIEFGAVVNAHHEKSNGYDVIYAEPIKADDTLADLTGIAVADVKGQGLIGLGQKNQFINVYAKGQALSVLTKGYIWVPVQSSGTVNAGDVYVRVKANSSNASLPIGGIETAADSTAANTVKWVGVRFTGVNGFPLSGTTDGTSSTGVTCKTAEIVVNLDLI